MNSCSMNEAKALQARTAKIFARFSRVLKVDVVKHGYGYGLKVVFESTPSKDLLSVIPTQVAGIPVRYEVAGQREKA